MKIRCGSCKMRHDTVNAVRLCHMEMQHEEIMMAEVRRAENGYERHLEDAGYEAARAQEVHDRTLNA